MSVRDKLVDPVEPFAAVRERSERWADPAVLCWMECQMAAFEAIHNNLLFLLQMVEDLERRVNGLDGKEG